MDREAVAALAQEVLVSSVPVGQVLCKEGLPVSDVVIVRQGSVRVRNTLSGQAQVLGPGGVLNFREVLLGAAACSATARAAGTRPCQVWLLAAGAVQRVLAARPAVEAALLAQLGERMRLLEEQAQRSSARAKALAPYLVAAPHHGIVGNSKYADRLRRQVVEAARDSSRRPVLIFGEPGLEKANLASLIHFGGPCRAGAMVALDCSRLDGSGAELFGRGNKPGLLEWLGEGTLLLKNFHNAPSLLGPRLLELLADGTFRPAPAPPAYGPSATASLGSLDGADAPAPRCALCRVVMTACKQVPALDKVQGLRSIKVPPLRLRPSDVKELQRFYLAQLARRQAGGDAGAAGSLVVTPAALRQLESYAWPGNITEVATVVERAALQATDSTDKQLSEEVFWFAKQAKDRFRINLLATYPPLRALLRSELWPSGINFNFTVYAFPALVALLMWGPQERLSNPGLALFWDYWWPLIFVAYPFLGRIWCAICPFMIYGELMQRWRVAQGTVLRKWPREQAERYGPWFLLSLFAAILVWEECWDLPNTAALSGWLLLLITAGAVVCSALFERRLWCRYLCPIGGMNALFAKLSATELRARQGVCAGECSTYHCYKGGCAQPPEGLASPGCPLYSHPAQLADNAHCVLCMECLKACPHGSVEFRLRLPGADLLGDHTTTPGELSVMFMLLGAVYLHHLHGMAGQVGITDLAALEGVNLPHITVSWIMLTLPGAAAWGLDIAWRAALRAARKSPPPAAAPAATSGGSGGSATASPGLSLELLRSIPEPAPFLSLAYGYMPLVWAATLSHYLRPLLEEGGTLLPITANMFGWHDAMLPALVAHPAVVAFLQGASLLAGAGWSLVLTRKLGAQPWPAVLPQAALIGVFTAHLWTLIV